MSSISIQYNTIQYNTITLFKEGNAITYYSFLTYGLPIDRYNRYRSNQIYRFLSIYRLSNRYRFFYRLTTPGFNRRSDKPGSSYLRGRPRQAYCSYCVRKTLIRYHNGRRQPSPFARSLGKSGRVSLGDITAHSGVQDWPSRERIGTRLGRRHLLVWRKALN